MPMCPLQVEENLGAALGEGETLETELVLESASLTAPVAQGQQVGELICSLRGEELGRVPVVAAKDVPCDQSKDDGILERILARIAAL